MSPFRAVLSSWVSLGLVVGIAACASAGGSPTEASSDGSVGSPSDEASVIEADASVGDAASSTETGTSKPDSGVSDGGGDPLLPSPPAGFTKCGSGAITPASALASCQKYDTAIPSRPKQCDGATLTGGSWERWCKGDDRWVYARFEGVKIAQAFPCSVIPAILGASQHYVSNKGSGGGDWNVTACSSPSGCMASESSPSTLTIERSMTAGAGGIVAQSFYVTATPQIISCPPPVPSANPSVVLGVDIDVK